MAIRRAISTVRQQRGPLPGTAMAIRRAISTGRQQGVCHGGCRGRARGDWVLKNTIVYHMISHA
eukprot:877108-Prymnesium_polylepis.1